MTEKDIFNGFFREKPEEHEKKENLSALESYLKTAHETTNFGDHKITMSTGWAINQPMLTQEFEVKVGAGQCVGYKELIVYVSFGDNKEWAGPALKWLYMDRTERWDGEQKRGTNIEELRQISEQLHNEWRELNKL